MSVINAIAEVRTFRAANGAMEVQECCRLLRVRPGSAAVFDYDAVEELGTVWHLFDLPPIGREEMLREILRTLILQLRPSWGLLLQHGRSAIRQNVSADVRQCFETAGFFKDVPDSESIAWWDELANHFRSVSVLGRMEVGRRGEMMSMDYERDRLATQGHTGQEPLWLAIEDETLGYDILSCEIDSGSIKPVYIEVKASEKLPFIFFLTENEWRVAQTVLTRGGSYVFHFWHLPTKALNIVKVDDVAKHIPLNQGAGIWKKVQILWPAS